MARQCQSLLWPQLRQQGRTDRGRLRTPRARARRAGARARVPAPKTEDESSSLQVQPACAAHSVSDTRHATARSVPRFLGSGGARAGARGPRGAAGFG